MKWVRRVLLVLVAIPVLLGLGLVAAGQRNGAGRNEARIDIARPAAQVFRHLENEQLLKQWTGVAEVKPLTEGGLRRGARFRMAVEVRGQRTEMEGEVTAVERDRFISLAVQTVPGAAIPFHQLVSYRLEPRDGATRLAVTSDTQYAGLVPRLLEPLITSAGQKRLETSLARLVAQVEAEPATQS
jgi:uncharacterized protein YndB with AHSA1/START domain